VRVCLRLPSLLPHPLTCTLFPYTTLFRSHLKVDAGSGGVTVRLPASLSAEVDIETGSGGIDTDFAVQVTRVEQRHMVGRIGDGRDRKSTRLNSSHVAISYAVFCLKKKKKM